MAKEVICPPCGEAIRAENDDELVRAVQDHAEREHSTTLTADHILESAREV
jgi:predicted small metal-binding protein